MTDLSIAAVNNSTIKIHEQRICKCVLDNVTYSHKFIIADVIMNIIGIVFIARNNLIFKLLNDKIVLFRNIGLYPANMSNCIHSINILDND